MRILIPSALHSYTGRPWVEASVGLYFGTTSGELWQSSDEGRQWECLARHLPEIYAVEVAYPR